jgi:endonuclease/exonuclease/phosphatase family metal-dependent hydrolase
MVKTGLILLLFISIFIGCAHDNHRQNQQEESIALMSYNLRFDNPNDGVNVWDNRKEHVAALIRFYRPDFFGQQEGLIHQVEYLDDELEDYDWIGVGRDDGDRAGELSSLHYNSTRYELIEDTGQTIWLSETPDEPSQSWDAALPRILTFGKFRDKSSGREFYVFNTHFDHRGQTAREESARIIKRKIEELATDGNYFVLGDFNVMEDNPVYEILTTGNPPLRDAFYHSENPHVGPLFTFEGFEVKSGIEQRRIDYIFVPDNVRVLNHAILGHFRNGYYPFRSFTCLRRCEIPGLSFRMRNKFFLKYSLNIS